MAMRKARRWSQKVTQTSNALDLPPPWGALSLPMQAVWCMIIGRQRMFGGESYLVARSGLRFTRLTAAQHTALAATLRTLATGLQPIA